MAKVDMDGSGLLNFPEFLAMMGYKVGVYCLMTISVKCQSFKAKYSFPLQLFLIKTQADAENAEDEIREAFQVFDGVSLRLNSQQFFGQSSMLFIRMAMDS